MSLLLEVLFSLVLCQFQKVTTKVPFSVFSHILIFFSQDNRTRRNYYHKVAYKSSDVDLFIYGLDSEEAANKKIEEIYESVCEAIPNPVIAFRSKNAITLVSQFPYRHIQIVRNYYFFFKLKKIRC